MFFSSSRSTESRWRAASSARLSFCSSSSAASSAARRALYFSSRPARTLASCVSFSASIVRYFTVSARSCLASSRWAVSAPAASSSAGRRLFAVSAEASAAALATCASVRRAVSAVISVRRLSFRAPLRSLSWVRRSSALFSAASSAASCCPAASMEAATARWRSNAAAASVLSC